MDLDLRKLGYFVAVADRLPLADDFFAAAQETAEVTAECGNYEMWQLANDTVSKRG